MGQEERREVGGGRTGGSKKGSMTSLGSYFSVHLVFIHVKY